MRALQSTLQNNISKVEFDDLGFFIAYNSTSLSILGIPVFDLWEAFKQKLQTITVRRFLRILANLDEATEEEKAFYLEEMKKINNSIVNGNQDLRRHENQYRIYVEDGKNVILVGHSQGNFFANQAHALLQTEVTAEQAKCFSVISVATPDNNVAGKAGPYVTSDIDFVIAALEPLINPLDPNVSNVPSLKYWSGHGFEKSYLSGNNSQNTILDHIEGAIGSNACQPELMLSVGTNRNTYTQAGDIINYTYDITNNGNRVVSEELFINDNGVNGIVDCPKVELLPKRSIACTASYAVTQQDIVAGSITSSATAFGLFGAYTVQSQSVTHTVTCDCEPSIELVLAIPSHSISYTLPPFWVSRPNDYAVWAIMHNVDPGMTVSYEVSGIIKNYSTCEPRSFGGGERITLTNEMFVPGMPRTALVQTDRGAAPGNYTADIEASVSGATTSLTYTVKTDSECP